MDSANRREALIELRYIHKMHYLGGEEVWTDDDINLKIDRGEFVAIVSRSGSDKSTLMDTIEVLDVPMDGECLLGGEDIEVMDDKQLVRTRDKMIGFIFQQHNLLSEFSILENAEPLPPYAGIGGAERREQAMAFLEKVGLSEKWRNMPNQLPGGQQQRASTVRALAGSPSLILADEPTGTPDSRTSRDVLGFLKQLNEEGNTIVMTTHNNTIAMKARRVVRIKDRQINSDGDIKNYATII